jgi:hypothetical protein
LLSSSIAPAFRSGKNRWKIYSGQGVLTPVIEKQTGSICQGLKPQRRLVSCYPRPESRGY